MLPLLILGVILALVLVLVLRWAVAVPPGQLLRVLGWTIGGVVLVTVVFLAVTGRLTWALAGLAALVPWAVRLARLATFGRGMAGLFHTLGGSGGFGPARGRAGPDPDDSSTVTTRFLRMTLSHASGAMTGVVREGPLEGRSLDDLTREEVATLTRQVWDDPESARVLDAWLERTHPDWREDAADAGRGSGGGREGAPAANTGPMTRAEALAVLGLDEGADEADIRAAHRRLIVLVHPDRGGTPYLAARLNQARDVLLDRTGR